MLTVPTHRETLPVPVLEDIWVTDLPAQVAFAIRRVHGIKSQFASRRTLLIVLYVVICV